MNVDRNGVTLTEAPRIGLVSTGTWLRAGRSDVQVSAGAEPGSGLHPNSYSVGNGFLSRESSNKTAMLTTRFHLPRRLRMMELYIHALIYLNAVNRDVTFTFCLGRLKM